MFKTVGDLRAALAHVSDEHPLEISVCDPRHYYTDHPNHYDTVIVDVCEVEGADGVDTLSICVRGRS
jgi:spermidine synthase